MTRNDLQHFQEVYFLPDLRDPEWRIPVAGMFRARDGRPVVVPARAQPGPTCLGGRTRSELCAALREALAAAEDPFTIVPRFGEHVVVGPVRVAPGDVDLVDWLENALPRYRRHQRDETLSSSSDAAAEGPARTRIRRKQGEALLRTLAVDQYVNRTFRSGDIPGWLPPHSDDGLAEVSHWVEGRETVLLMEPVAPARPKFEDELRELRGVLGAWRDLVERRARGPRRGRIVGYILRGGSREQRDHAARIMAEACHAVVDTEAVLQRQRFKVDIVETHRSAAGQARFP